MIFPWFLVEIRCISRHKYFLFMLLIGIMPSIEVLYFLVHIFDLEIWIQLKKSSPNACETHICPANTIFKRE